MKTPSELADEIGEKIYTDIVDLIGKQYVVVSIDDGEEHDVVQLDEILPELLCRTIEPAISSRDTYWKERVRKEVDGMRKYTGDSEDWGSAEQKWELNNRQVHNQALDTLLDNLK